VAIRNKRPRAPLYPLAAFKTFFLRLRDFALFFTRGIWVTPYRINHTADFL
jgi:hypothetical protein